MSWKLVYDLLKKQGEKVVSKQHFEENYHQPMSKEQWRRFRELFPECVLRKPGTNFYSINVTKWQQSFNQANS